MNAPVAPGTVSLSGQVRLDGRALFAPVRLVLPAGKWTALLGDSGVGKSTLLRLLAGLPIGGQFTGRIDNPQPAALMAQDPGLLPWLDVRQNAALGSRLRGTRADAARLDDILARTGLRDHAAKRPAQLSGGQRQRVALARTLMEDRPLVLLDEPFSALDARTRAQMQDLSARLLADRTVLLVTHDPAEAARLGDRILLLREEGLTEWPAPPPRPEGAARPYDAPEVLALQADLMRGMMA